MTTYGENKAVAGFRVNGITKGVQNGNAHRPKHRIRI